VLLKELQDFHKFRLILGKAGDLVAAVESKDIDTTLGIVQNMYSSVYVEANTNLDDYEMSALASRDIKFEFRKTGIREWDKRGGLIKGGLTIVAAEAKAGKSTLCGQIALHQYLNEEGSICVLSYEMSSQEYRSRILANYCDIDLGRLMSNTMTEEEQRNLRVKESQFYTSESEEVAQFALANLDVERESYFQALFAMFPRRENKLYVIDERLDWMSLFAKMQLLVETKGVVTFVVDYINLVPMSADTKHLAQWEALLSQSRKLKNFSHKYGLNMITPAQLSVGKKGEESKIRFASNIIADCDICLTLQTTEEDKVLGTVTCEFKAIRNGLSVDGQAFHAPFRLVKEFEHSRFANEVDF
jgi:replicative DNA helicase